MGLSTTELTRRKPVWIALSEFYLDTELTQEELARIRVVLVKSGYSEKEILAINYNEVAPVLIGNMWIWNGFDEQWVEEAITKRMGRKARKLHIPGLKWLSNKRVDFSTNAYFKQVFPL